MWGISILVDFRPIGYKLSCCGILWVSQIKDEEDAKSKIISNLFLDSTC